MNINSVEDLLSALNFGSGIRQTDSTAMNAKSSRSHAVFSLNLIQNKGPGAQAPSQEKRMSVPIESVMYADATVTTDSKLHFVDLAGSERLKNTGAQGERAKEGISINAGLASLGKVISQLSSRNPGGHVSYRDSRLTRLLQDSLGGNAITYMVACVTPAEFHLSETLNTVHYAQRARAIQSKPEIQQTSDDADKAGRIERLQAEVAFLRDQIKHERQNEKSIVSNDKSNRREAELQNQLLDMQESYNALSQRHAKLISEISKARDNESADTPTLKDVIGESALDRLKRSNSFAEAVEQVVLEYEKTIQSLENSLNNTRSSLSNNESTLMEKESKIAYMENVASQLQARLQKAAERENNNDAYLHDLEVQMESVTTSEEKSSALIQSLRKELARVKNSEGSAEEYISTLEERLAEAEQDQEIMQREIDRLETVVERQRSIGRLDNLLAELDTIRKTEEQPRHKQLNGHRSTLSDPFQDQNASGPTTDVPDEGGAANKEVQDEEQVQPGSEATAAEDDLTNGNDDGVLVTKADAEDTHEQGTGEDARSQFMADKLETISQELFDLRAEHETTRADHDELQRKYEIALQTLAKLQDVGEEDIGDDVSTPRGTGTSTSRGSFLTDAGMSEDMEDGQPSSSRSLSEELSLRTESPTTLEQEMTESKEKSTEDDEDIDPAMIPLPAEKEELLAHQLRALKRLQGEKEAHYKEITENYTQLQQEHQHALVRIDNMKAELQRAQLVARPSSPMKPLLRRKPSQDLMSMSLGNSDRATRSFASLRNIALDNFEDNPDTRQSFELNLNTLMTELHNRMERVQALEVEVATVRKEMDSKTTIISGLTRERSSLKATSNVDFSVVGHMQDQIKESEQQIRSLHESHAAREQELQSQIERLREKLEQYAMMVAASGALPTPGTEHAPTIPGDFVETPAAREDSPKQLGEGDSVTGADHAKSDIAQLQQELADWESRHNEAMQSMQASETKLLNTIAELEASLNAATSKDAPENEDSTESPQAIKESSILEQERTKHQELVDALQAEIGRYKATSQEQGDKLAALEQSYTSVLQKFDEDSQSHGLTQKELDGHREMVANLEQQLAEHRSTIDTHQQKLESLQMSHTRDIEELKQSIVVAEKESNDRQAALEEQHKAAVANLEAEVKKFQDEMASLLQKVSSLLGKPTDATNVHDHIKRVINEKLELENQQIRSVNEVKEMQDELQAAMTKIVNLENSVGELKMLNEETMKNLEEVADKERKSSRLVQELEDQLNSNFDQHQATTNRLSSMQNERHVALEEALHAREELEKELEDARTKTSMLEVSSPFLHPCSPLTIIQSQLLGMRRGSSTSTVRERDSSAFNRDSLSPEAAAIALARSSQISLPRKSTPPTTTALPSPPPAIPLPPLPNSPTLSSPQIPSGIDYRASSPINPSRPTSPMPMDPALTQKLDEADARIRTIEKHLFAEKQLTATLEEALVDLETSQNKTRQELEAWRRKAAGLEDELVGLRKERSSSRASLQQVEEEREMRVRAEKARMALEERMRELNAGKKKKKGTLNCF